jgi:hypothetical protein
MLIDAIGHGINVHAVDRDRYRDAVGRLRARHEEEAKSTEAPHPL